MSRIEPDPIRVRVLCARWEAEGVASYELTPVDRSALPAWTPGAHIDVHLPSGPVRQYSLCGHAEDVTSYRIAVLELPHGRGGSREVHRALRPGIEIDVGCPRSNFALVPAERYVFVAGGIGITPLLPMIAEVRRRGSPWQLVYGARSHRHFAFADELAADGDRVRFVPHDVDGMLDLRQVALDAREAAVFCCGPAPLMDALGVEMDRAGRAGHLHIERFSPTEPAMHSDTDGFQVDLVRSGLLVDVAPDTTVLNAVRAAGVDAPSSCEMGICGTCETRVLSGSVDHRDELLTDAEKAQDSVMMICVSRARCPRLVLDL
jgi:ferredoxin-NADP reductase